MDENHYLRAIEYKGEFLCYELVPVSAAASELQKWENDTKKASTAVALYEFVKRIKNNGLAIATKTSKLRQLSSEEHLYEIKHYAGTNREMSCIILEDENLTPTIVLLFGFKGHQGNDKIPPKKKKRALKLSRIALRLLRAKGKTNEN